MTLIQVLSPLGILVQVILVGVAWCMALVGGSFAGSGYEAWNSPKAKLWVWCSFVAYMVVGVWPAIVLAWRG